MKKNYITPGIKVKEIEGCELLAGSGVGGTTGLDNQPGTGGDNDGSHSVGSKQNVFEGGFSDVWADDEDKD